MTKKTDKMSKLFEDAIADAKAVRDTAMHNAKIALEEAFAPKLQAMFSEKIRQEAEENEDTDVEIEEKPVEEAEDLDIELEDEPIEEAEDLDIELEDEPIEEAEDLDIELEDEPVTEGEEDVDIEIEDEEEVTSEDVDIDFNFDDEPVTEGEEDLDIELEDEPVTEGEEDIDIELETEDEPEETEEPKEKELEESKKQIKLLTNKLREAISVISKLRNSLNETNLLNSRLNHATKIFTEFNSLNDKQKLSIIDKFDEADSIKEVKLVYSTLTESLRGRTKLSGQAKRLTEGIASKTTGTTASSKKVLNESTDAIVKRFQKLANL